MNNTGPQFLFNLAIQDSSVFHDDFLHNGKNFYEVIRVMNGNALFIEDHISRLFSSALKSGFTIAFSASEIYRGLKLLIHSLKLEEGNIKIVWHTDDPSGKSFLIMYQTKYYYPDDFLYKKGVQCLLLNESRPEPEIKKWRASFKEKINQLKTRKDVYEIILVNEKGIVTEGSQSNLFIIKENKLFTAFKKNILPGITRKYILKIAKENDMHLEELDFGRDTLLSADAVFLTGTSPKVLPVAGIGENTFDVTHPLLTKIIFLYNLEISNYLKSHDYEI